MALGFRKFISEVFVNGKFPKILPSENFPLYGNRLAKIVSTNFDGFSLENQIYIYSVDKRTIYIAI